LGPTRNIPPAYPTRTSSCCASPAANAGRPVRTVSGSHVGSPVPRRPRCTAAQDVHSRSPRGWPTSWPGGPTATVVTDATGIPPVGNGAHIVLPVPPVTERAHIRPEAPDPREPWRFEPPRCCPPCDAPSPCTP